MRIDLPDPQGFMDIFQEETGIRLDTLPLGVTIDSRTCRKDDLYIALEGTQVDGHRFLEDVKRSGAAAALVREGKTTDQVLQTVEVQDPLITIGKIASLWRKRMDIPILAITGSNGKTSTKDMLKHCLSCVFSVHATQGNFNTSVGLPLTLLELSDSHTLSILEMGANQPGDITYLCEIASPTHGLITNVAPAHLEGFGTVEQVARTKGELFQALSQGMAFVNKADEWVRSLPVSGASVTYGLSPDCDFPADIHQETDGSLTLTIDSEEIATRSHNLSLARNTIAAAAVSITLGMDWDSFRDCVVTSPQPAGRCEVKTYNRITVIDDTYNANLVSSVAAIDYLNAFSGNGRRILVFGDMFELGSHSDEQHRKVGAKCSEANLDAVFTMGPESIYVDRELNSIPLHEHFDSQEKLVESLKTILKEGDKVLFKGSRGMAMETVIEEVFES